MTIDMNQLSFAIATAILAVSACTDLADRRVPNILTFSGMALGLILTAIGSGWGSAAFRAAWLAFFFLFGTLRLMGMGDLKLVMATTALRGPTEALLMLIFGAGLMIVYCLATRPKAMTEVLKDTGRFLTMGSPIREQEYKEYPFAMFLALGYAPAWILANCVMPM